MPKQSGILARLNELYDLVDFAIRDIFKNRIILLLIIVCLSVSFSAVFLASSILSGFQEMLINGAIGYLSDIVMTPMGNDKSIPHIDSVVQRLQRLPNVQSISIRSDTFVTGIKFGDKTSHPYRAVGVDNNEEGKTSQLAKNVIEGSFVNDKSRDTINLGLELADALVGADFDGQRISVGQKVEITMLNGTKKDYTVGGIIDAKTFLPNWFIVFSRNEAESMPGHNSDSELIIRLKNQDRMTNTKQEIQTLIPDVSVSTWREQSGYVDDIVQTISFIMNLINTLLTLTTFVVMSIIIFINVFQKRRQIGIIKSMGANNMFITLTFLLEAVIYATLSYGIGFLLFWAMHQYSLKHPISILIGDFHTVFDPTTMGISLVTFAAAALGGSVVPAYMAARTKIVDVIRDNV